VNRISLGFVPLVALLGCASGPTVPREQTCADVRVPTITQLDGHRLALNGMAVREVSILSVDVYVGALYLEHGTRDAEEFVTSAQHKRLELHFVHDIGREAVVRFVRWGFSNNDEELRSRYESQADWIEQFFEDYVAGDVVAFDYRPGRGIRMSKNGIALGDWTGDEFAQVFFRVFVGPKPGNRTLREGLIGGICNP